MSLQVFKVDGHHFLLLGGGKTMLMDLFYNTTASVGKKRRTHFHEFMLDVHQSKFLCNSLIN